MPHIDPVGQFMTTEMVTFAPSDNVRQAMVRMLDLGVDGAPVVDEAGVVVGLLSTADLIVQESQLHFPTVITILGATLERPSAKRQFDEDLRRALGSTVGEVMTTDPVTVTDDDTLEVAATLMHERDVSRLPVVRDGVLVGIISRTDILRAVIADPTEDELPDVTVTEAG